MPPAPIEPRLRPAHRVRAEVLRRSQTRAATHIGAAENLGQFTSPTSLVEPPKARANARSSDASSGTSSARSTTSSKSTPQPAKSGVDNYRSVNALAECRVAASVSPDCDARLIEVEKSLPVLLWDILRTFQSHIVGDAGHSGWPAGQGLGALTEEKSSDQLRHALH